MLLLLSDILKLTWKSLFFRKCKAEIDMILMVKNYLLWGVLNVCIPHPPSKIYVT